MTTLEILNSVDRATGAGWDNAQREAILAGWIDRQEDPDSFHAFVLAVAHKQAREADFITWVCEQLPTLRWEFRHRGNRYPYLAFPEWCRQQWEAAA